jgi:hypothetical protein
LAAKSLARVWESKSMRQALLEACREVALRSAEKAVGPGGDMASFVAEKAARKAVFARLSDQRGGASRVSNMLVTQLTENVIENKRSVFELLTREQLLGFIEAFQPVQKSKLGSSYH